MTDASYGLTKQMVMAIFRAFMPDDALVIAVDHEEYIQDALRHPFIQRQIAAGIYTEESIYTDFLSVAKTFARERVCEVDLDLIVSHMNGVPVAEALGYVTQIALHERHHMETHGGVAASAEEQMQREVECAGYLNHEHPETMELARKAERQSTTIQRVYNRMAGLRP